MVIDLGSVSCPAGNASRVPEDARRGLPLGKLYMI